VTELRNYVIRKGAYYYRPNCQGYTAYIADAGRYTKEEAEREARIEPWHMQAICIDGMTWEQMVSPEIRSAVLSLPDMQRRALAADLVSITPT
jgi:hypothetical protein